MLVLDNRAAPQVPEPLSAAGRSVQQALQRPDLHTLLMNCGYLAENTDRNRAWEKFERDSAQCSSTFFMDLPNALPGLKSHDIVDIAPLVAGCSTLRRLDLISQECFSEEGTAAMAEALQVNTGLTHLDLSFNLMGTDRMRVLSTAFTINHNLTTVILDSREGIASALKPLLLALAVIPSLTHLSISHPLHCLSEDGIVDIAGISPPLACHPKLRHLALRCQHLGDEGAATIAEVVGQTTTLTSLELSSSAIGSTGINALSAALRINSSLVRLMLDGNRGDEASFRSLLQVLKSHLSLTHINLSHMHLGVGMNLDEHVVSVIETNTRVTDLILDAEFFSSNPGILQKMKGPLQRNSSLCRLFGPHAYISNSGAFSSILTAPLNRNIHNRERRRWTLFGALFARCAFFYFTV
ncbi:MAG: hypothetical protein ACHQUC_02615 [Chlamydiales bacterium]